MAPRTTDRPRLAADPATDRLADPSVTNVRAMLRAALPLRDRTANRAVALVVGDVVNPTRSRRSRRECQPNAGHDP